MTPTRNIAFEGRLPWVDILKGFAIFLVVLGHAIAGVNETLRALIYSFHMPLFFALAGITAALSMKKNQSSLAFIKAKLITIFIPYLVWCFLIGLIFTDLGTLYAYDWHNRFEIFISGNVLVWFLPCLLVLQFCFLIYSKISSKLNHSILLKIALFISLTVILLALNRLYAKSGEGVEGKLEWITNSARAIPSFFLGVFLVEWKAMRDLILYSRLSMFLCVGIILFGPVVIKLCPFMGTYTLIVFAAPATIILIRLVNSINLPRFASEQLQLLGRNTLIIYFVSNYFLSQFSNELLLTNANYAFVVCGIFSIMSCYLSIILSKIIGFSPELSFVLLGKMNKKN